MFPAGFSLIVDAARRDATSAQPDAPVLADDDTASVSARARVVLATALRSIAAHAGSAAERVEPRFGIGMRSSS